MKRHDSQLHEPGICTTSACFMSLLLRSARLRPQRLIHVERPAVVCEARVAAAVPPHACDQVQVVPQRRPRQADVALTRTDLRGGRQAESKEGGAERMRIRR